MFNKDKITKKNNIFGYILIFIGILFILKLFNIVKFEISFWSIIGTIFACFWPLVLIFPGLMIHYKYFRGDTSDSGILIPGGIFLGVGLTCQVGMLFGIWHIVWPGFILSVAIGLFEFYFFGGKNKGILIPVGILSFLSILFFLNEVLYWINDSIIRQVLIAVFLIIAGILVIFKK